MSIFEVILILLIFLNNSKQEYFLVLKLRLCISPSETIGGVFLQLFVQLFWTALLQSGSTKKVRNFKSLGIKSTIDCWLVGCWLVYNEKKQPALIWIVYFPSFEDCIMYEITSRLHYKFVVLCYWSEPIVHWLFSKIITFKKSISKHFLQ